MLKVQPTSKEELKKIIEETIETEGLNCDLNFIDVSKITDMSYLFFNSKFNGDISKWNVSMISFNSSVEVGFTDSFRIFLNFIFWDLFNIII